ncbi:Na+/H+ antiporter subunit E [candidate division KSB1 bacterium]
MGSKNTGFVIKSRVWLFDFLLLFLIWLALTWTLDPFTVVVGILAAAVTVLYLSDLFPAEMVVLFSPRRLFWLLVYIPYFFYYLLKANFDVLYRVLHPDLPINPGIVKILTGLSSDMGKSFLANSITLTPGTLTVDIDGEYLYVHWINVTTQDIEEASKIISGRFEKIIRRIFE